MSPRTPFIYPPAGGGGVEWATLLDADFSGAAGDALVNGGTITRSGVVWTFGAHSDTRQTWTPAADGIDIAVTNTTITRNSLSCAIDDALVLGRLPDNYDVFAVQALYIGVTAPAGTNVVGIAYGHRDAAVVAGGGMLRPVWWAVGSHLGVPRWFVSLRTATGSSAHFATLDTGVAAPDDQPVVVGAVITDIMGGQVFGEVNRSTLYDAPGDLVGLMMHRSHVASDRPEVDRIGAVTVSNATSLTATLSRIRIQHFRLPGAPDPA